MTLYRDLKEGRYSGQHPSFRSLRQRAMSCTHTSSVRPTAVHSPDRFPTTGFSDGSKAYCDHWSYRSS